VECGKEDSIKRNIDPLLDWCVWKHVFCF